MACKGAAPQSQSPLGIDSLAGSLTCPHSPAACRHRHPHPRLGIAAIVAGVTAPTAAVQAQPNPGCWANKRRRRASARRRRGVRRQRRTADRALPVRRSKLRSRHSSRRRDAAVRGIADTLNPRRDPCAASPSARVHAPTPLSQQGQTGRCTRAQLPARDRRLRQETRAMDLNFTTEELAFPARGAAMGARQPAAGHRPQGPQRLAPHARRYAALGARSWARRAGWATAGPSSSAARAGPRCRSTCSRKNARAPEPRASMPFGAGDGGAGDHGLRHARAAAALPARHRPRRGVVEPGLQRAGRGLGPGLGQDHAPSARATSTSSTARRPGPRSASTATGSSAWCAPTPKASRRPAFPSC